MLLLKNVRIIDAPSPHHGKKRDVLIDQGIIKKIGTRITASRAKIITAKNLHVSIGWFDIGVQPGEPGFEHREDFQTLSDAASAGGYTGVACFPNTQPTVQSKADILFLKNQSTLVDLFPIGAVSRDCQGKDLAELYDMTYSGGVAFSDGAIPIQSNGLMKRSLEYVKGINGLIINHPHDKELAKGGQINEGRVSTALGMKGLPNLSEELMLKRDLDLLEYTESRLHVHNISTAGSVQLIKDAKKKNLNLTASVAVANLLFDESSVEQFDTNFKVLPPLRSNKDVKALVKGLKEGVIDAITTNHVPLEKEAKQLEFLYADFGMLGLETTFALLQTHLGNQLPLTELIDKLTYQSRKILQIQPPQLTEGATANLTLFSPTMEWTMTQQDIYSKSQNTPFVGQSFIGKVLGVLNGEQHWLRN